jgi:pimeloyl-ACP methyl ester carboxylesterase
MFYEEYGSRELPTVIMLHGAGLVHSFVNQYVLSDKFHLVIPHLFGNGRESAETFSVRKTVDAIVELVRQIGKTKVSVVGFSMGAQLIVPLLCDHEQLFDRAVLVSPWVLKNSKTLKSYAKMTASTYIFTKSKALIKLQSKMYGLNEAQTNECISYYQLMTKENLIAFITDGVNIHDYTGFKDVRIPMLVLSGKKEIKEMTESVNYLGGINPNCKVEVWDNYRHEIPMKNAERFNKTLVDFLK